MYIFFAFRGFPLSSNGYSGKRMVQSIMRKHGYQMETRVDLHGQIQIGAVEFTGKVQKGRNSYVRQAQVDLREDCAAAVNWRRQLKSLAVVRVRFTDSGAARLHTGGDGGTGAGCRLTKVMDLLAHCGGRWVSALATIVVKHFGGIETRSCRKQGAESTSMEA